jgi:hypothetical protein
MKNLKLIFLLMFIVGCAPQVAMRQTVYRNEATSLDALTQEDKETFDTNWKIAEKLVEQDKMAWIATDSILPRLTDKEKELIRGYVTNGSLLKGEVFFFSENSDKEISVVVTASFFNGRFAAATKGDINVDSRIVDMAKCIQKAKQINLEYIANQKVNYNSYAFDDDNGITVYLAPGSIDGYFIFCGGIKAEFDKNLNLKSKIELHKSIVVFETRKMGDIMARSSSVASVINEIDILQFLIWKDVVYNQMIATDKYGFFLYNVPDEERIITRAIKLEEMKK